jgi:inactive STAND/TIR domain
MNQLRIFISYSHEDDELRDDLTQHLAFLGQYGDPIWDDRKIYAGSDWERELHENLNAANIILLLVSATFLASKYCYGIEFKRAMERYEAGEAIVIPIILREVHWRWDKNLARLQALPNDAHPVISSYWKGDRDAAFRNVAEGIQKRIEELTPKVSVMPSSLKSAKGNLIRHSYDKPFNNVYDALSNLNYIEQRKLFRYFIDSNYNIGSFLLHGKKWSGQDWLLNELLRQVDNLSTARYFKFSFGSICCGGGFEDLWYDLGEWIGQNTCSPNKIVEEIYALWQTKTIIFILRDVDLVEEYSLHNFLFNFWYPLTKKAKASNMSNYCLLFLVGYRSCKWNLLLTKNLEPPGNPYYPIELKELTNFPRKELELWINREYRLPSSLTIDKILENSEEGLPELVLKNICALSGDNWRKRAAAWITY